MPFPDRLENAVAAYRAAEAELDQARSTLRREIVRARERDGASMRVIGDILGVSRQRVREILRDEGAVPGPQETKKRVA